MAKSGKKAKKRGGKKARKRTQTEVATVAEAASTGAPADDSAAAAEVMVEPTVVDLWVDPQCPWSWLASRWLLEVESVRPVRMHLHVMSLSVLNEHRAVPPDERERLDQGWAVVRVTLAVAEHYGPEQLSRFYTALGTRIHLGHEGLGRDTVAAALDEVGLPPELIARGDTGDNDDALRASHWDAMNRVGPDNSSPVISIAGRSFSGPFLTHRPHGEAAGQLYDHLAGLIAYPGFYALKRTADAAPDFD